MLPLSYSSLRTAFDLVQMFQILRGGLGPFAVMAKLQQLGYLAEDFYYQRMSGTAPAWFSTRLGTQVLVAIDGISTPLQGASLFGSLALPMRGQDGWLANPVGYNDVLSIVDVVKKVYGGKSLNLFAAGYSYGGSLSELLAAILNRDGALVLPQIVTFGSPRPGNEALANALSMLAVRRWMCDDDPIPHFPPHGDEAPLGTSQLPFPVAFNASLYSQPHGGVAIYRNGRTRGVIVSPSFLPITDIDLLGWATGADGIKARAHSLDEYLSRISSVIAVESQEDAPNTGPSGSEIVSALSIAEFNALALLARAFLLQPGNGSLDMAFIPVKYRVGVAKMSSDQWTVNWMGVVIGQTITRSQAKTTAKYLNKWLRVALADLDVDVNGLAAAFALYWPVAVLGGNGFGGRQLTL